MMNIILETSVSLLPSIILLLVFVLMDSYKLLNIKTVIIAIIIGALAALGAAKPLVILDTKLFAILTTLFSAVIGFWNF